MAHYGRNTDALTPARGILNGTLLGGLIWLPFILWLLAGCAPFIPTPPASLQLGEHPYRAGEFRVFVLTAPEVEDLCSRYMTRRLGFKAGGCYIPSLKALVTIPPSDDDLAYWVLLHEFRHGLEGAFHP